MAEPIEMSFGMMRGCGLRNSVLRRGDDPWSEGAIFGQNMCPTSLTPRWIANWTGPCSGVHIMVADTWLQALNESIIGCKGERSGIAHRGRSLISTIALLCLLWHRWLSHRKAIQCVKACTSYSRNVLLCNKWRKEIKEQLLSRVCPESGGWNVWECFIMCSADGDIEEFSRRERNKATFSVTRFAVRTVQNYVAVTTGFWPHVKHLTNFQVVSLHCVICE